MAKRLPDVIHLKELVFFVSIFSIVILILFIQRFQNLGKYYLKSEPQNGGILVEGVVGEIKSFNPIYEGLNPSEDDVNKLLFSGLIKKEKRNPIPDLALSWEIKDEGKTYIFHLKDQLKWHDGEPFTASDVVFTVGTIQDPDARSPLFNNWKDIGAVEIDKLTVKFTLPDQYSEFLSNADFGILPKHIYEKIPGRNMPVAEFNSKPIGTGPFRFEKFEEKKTYSQIYLTAFRDNPERSSYIERVRIRTYKSESSLLEAYARKEITGISSILSSDIEEATKLQNITFYQTQIPRYISVFYNQKRELMKSKELRSALSKAIDKKSFLAGKGDKNISVNSPILPGFEGNIKNKNIIPFDQKASEAELDKLGWSKKDGKRTKDQKELVVNLVSSDSKENKELAAFIKESWGKIGVGINIQYTDTRTLIEDYIKPRNYDALLFGVSTDGSSDLFSLWHSSQKEDPGLNLSYFSNNKVDRYIELARKSEDKTKSLDMLGKAQEIILEEVPAYYFYSPVYTYGINKEVKGVDIEKIDKPSDRFGSISRWYINEKQYSSN